MVGVLKNSVMLWLTKAAYRLALIKLRTAKSTFWLVFFLIQNFPSLSLNDVDKLQKYARTMQANEFGIEFYDNPTRINMCPEEFLLNFA